MNNPPLITIITLVYNTGHYVTEALESVRKQNYSNLQHIIIDDCSKDDSIEIVSNWLVANNYHCSFIKHPVNLGITKSMNEGLRLAEGKYVTFVSDDLLLSGKLLNQVSVFESLDNEYCVVYSDIKMVNDDGENLGTLFSNSRDFTFGPEGKIFEDLYLGNFIHGSAALLRVESLRAIGFYNESLIVEDIDLYLRLALKYKFKYDHRISAIYRIHEKSLLKTIGIKGLEQNLISLEPFCRYSERTFHYFVSYFDNAIKIFYKESYPSWGIWYKKRWKYKRDIKSINYYLVAVLNLNRHRLQRLKSLKRPNYLASRVFGKLFKSKNKEQKISMEKSSKKYSYSQCGEDLIVQYIFNLRGISRPSYIDIGANDPFYLSNTALFYEIGCRGINIEANPVLHNNFIIHRPQDVNLNIGVGDKNEELDFYIMEDNTLSTFSKEEYESMAAYGKLLGEIKKIKLTTIAAVLEKYFNNVFPDFMSIDVEGMDFQILQSINFIKSSPKVICVEAAEYSPIGTGSRRNELIDFLVSKNYYEYANTNLNAIMVRKDFWFI